MRERKGVPAHGRKRSVQVNTGPNDPGHLQLLERNRWVLFLLVVALLVVGYFSLKETVRADYLLQVRTKDTEVQFRPLRSEDSQR